AVPDWMASATWCSRRSTNERRLLRSRTTHCADDSLALRARSLVPSRTGWHLRPGAHGGAPMSAGCFAAGQRTVLMIRSHSVLAHWCRPGLDGICDLVLTAEHQ